MLERMQSHSVSYFILFLAIAMCTKKKGQAN